ncbi:MAG: outer membrane lipoprotein carrier protein LolA [Rhizobiales bacterium]|nr:outer membrane lipoprotein carrier protein LolA [Hyphomicrobiales bacterium]
MRIARRTFLTLAAATLITGVFGFPNADAAKSIQLSGEQAQSVKKLAAYINGITSLRGDFTQISPKGNVSKGVFLISKPGKMRFDYAPPNPFLIVSDGKWVTIKNRAKEKGDQFPLSQTPLRLVLGKNIDLLKETNILAIEQAEGLTSVMLEDRKGKMGGQLVLVFDETRNELQQWVVIDGKGRRTTVSLANIETGVKIDPKQFVVKFNRVQRGKDN